MALNIPPVLKSGTRELDQFARAVVDFIADLVRTPWLDGVLVTNQAIVAGTPREVQHGLGRPARGWFLVRKRASADVWDSQDAVSASLSKRTLTLNASANVTVDVWIF